MTVVVKLNKEPIIMFTLMISGYSLQKRKKLLTADIEKLNKNYSKYLDINRSRFIEDILR